MHKVFGQKEDVLYRDRPGAYVIPIRDGCAAVVRTRKGHFLLGGGLEPGESDAVCIERECLEEIGQTVTVGEKIGSAEVYCDFPTLGCLHLYQTYYAGMLLGKVQEPIETDHELVWIPVAQAREKMYHPAQAWAIEECWKSQNE